RLQCVRPVAHAGRRTRRRFGRHGAAADRGGLVRLREGHHRGPLRCRRLRERVGLGRWGRRRHVPPRASRVEAVRHRDDLVAPNGRRRVEKERRPDRQLGHVLGAPPLAGIRVVEIGNYMAGPYCGMQLADLGADVVKVEHPTAGDLARLLEPLASGESGNFARLNRDKRSLAIDLKREEGRAIFRRLAERADVIVENLRPGTMDDLGLPPASLLEANPRLVYVAVTGWGLDGPYADRPALDIIVQGQSGLMSITGEEGGAPVKVGVSIADLTAALYATIATLAALRARERDGRGQLVD